MINNGYALVDIVKEISNEIMKMELPPQILGYMSDKLSDLE